MKIVFIAIAPYPGITFPELRNAATELVRLCHEVTVICKRLPRQPLKEKVDGVFVERLACDSRWATEMFFFRAARIAKQLRPDITHVFWRFGAGIVPFVLGRRQTLLDIRTGSIDTRAWRRWLENTWLQIDRKLFRHAITLDQPLAQHLGLRVNGFVPEGIPTTMVVGAPGQERDIIRQEQHWSPNEIIGVYIGTSYLRRLDVFFQSWRASHLPARLVVIGDAIHDPVLRSLAEQSTSRIELRGGLPPEQIWRLLKAVDFGVAFVPNTPGFAYQQSTKILEYLAADLPVVATATPANARIIHDRMNGLLIPDNEPQLSQGLQDFIRWLPTYQVSPIQRQHMINEYSWMNIIKHRLLPIYQQLQ